MTTNKELVLQIAKLIKDGMNTNVTYQDIARNIIAAMGDGPATGNRKLQEDALGSSSPASDSIGSPTRYTDGTISREYEEQNIQTTPVSIHSAEDVNKHKGDASARKDEAARSSVTESPASDCPKSTVDKDNCPKQGGSPASNSKFSRNYDDSNKLALREKSVVDAVKTILFPYLHDQITTAAAQKLIAELKPYLRSEPVSLAKCAFAVENIFDEAKDDPTAGIDERKIAKAILTAAGVKYVD